MARGNGEITDPSRARMIISAVFVALIVALVWGIIQYRQQPPPPPHKIGERVEVR